MSNQTYPWVRPPATPLITHDPYFSIWSANDRLTEGWTKHWTGAEQKLVGAAVIDGQPYRFLGGAFRPQDIPVMQQQQLQVWPLRTIYTFAAGGVRLMLQFTSPLLPEDLDLLSRPLTYISFSVQAVDGQAHVVQVFFGVSAGVAAENRREEVTWARYRLGELNTLSAAAAQQRLLERSGDNLRIEWGSLYLAAAAEQSELWPGYWQAGFNSLLETGHLPQQDDLRMPRAAADEEPALTCLLPFGQVDSQPVSRVVMVAYDDRFSIEYLNRKLRPYWRRNGMQVDELLQSAWREYPALLERSRAFDEELLADLAALGGEQYAVLCALAYRQAMAAHKLVADLDGQALFFSKENFSNGCIGTIDITYPTSPLGLLFNPALLKGMLTPILDYAQSGRWRFPFAPHDLGQYPLANGQVYGGGERGEENQMPVEESGNVLILMAAIAKVDGNADYARKYAGLLRGWADYLCEKGLDPENQLCTDDFAGHLAHNTNLSIKAIMGLGGYAQLLEQFGEPEQAQVYRATAQQMAAKWLQQAADGDHYRLTFDRPGTWSQKYNLVWDQLLGLNLFPADLARTEMAYYLTRQNRYGLPLDNRREYTKLDWIVWTASLAENAEDFRAFITPINTWLNETPDRVPMADWYETVDGKAHHFQARAVVGGVFFKALQDPQLWKKWVDRAKTSD